MSDEATRRSDSIYIWPGSGLITECTVGEDNYTTIFSKLDIFGLHDAPLCLTEPHSQDGHLQKVEQYNAFVEDSENE